MIPGGPHWFLVNINTIRIPERIITIRSPVDWAHRTPVSTYLHMTTRTYRQTQRKSPPRCPSSSHEGDSGKMVLDSCLFFPSLSRFFDREHKILILFKLASSVSSLRIYRHSRAGRKYVGWPPLAPLIMSLIPEGVFGGLLFCDISFICEFF